MNTKTNDPKQTAPETEPVVDDIKTEPVTPDAEEKADKKTAQKEGKEKEPKASKEPKESKEKKETKKEIEADLAAEKDKYLRLLAEYDNFRKRSQKEKESVYGEAIEDAVMGLLPVIDNLQYASKYGNADPEKFAEGVRLILDKLPENLAKLNVKPFGAPGDTFDPNLHNAVMHEENDAYGEGEIIDVLQCGYLYGDRVIRYAMVKVAN